jgi:hypothetical protein
MALPLEIAAIPSLGGRGDYILTPIPLGVRFLPSFIHCDYFPVRCNPLLHYTSILNNIIVLVPGYYVLSHNMYQYSFLVMARSCLSAGTKHNARI